MPWTPANTAGFYAIDTITKTPVWLIAFTDDYPSGKELLSIVPGCPKPFQRGLICDVMNTDLIVNYL